MAQTVAVPGDVEANLDQHVRLAHQAAEAGARVVVFPELSLTGYEISLAKKLAFARHDPRLAPLVGIASARALTLIVGAPVRLDSGLHIGAFIVTSDGQAELYTKHHLGAFSSAASCDGVVPPPEATVFRAGDRNPLISVGGMTAGLAICADTGRPSHPRAAAERGAQAYLASMFVIPSEYDREVGNLRAYAGQYSMVVAFANYGGPAGGLASAGRSAIWSKQGELLAQLDESGAGVAVAIGDRGGDVTPRVRRLA